MSEADGTHPVQLTSFESHAGTPRWSPDGRKILFDSLESGNWDLYVVDAEGGVPQRLTSEPSDENTGTFSHDGRWIYFHSDRGDHSQIWKMPAEGGEPVQVTAGGGVYGEESWDGEYLYYIKSNSDTTIWRVPTGGGDEVEFLRGPTDWPSWTLSERGIYYMTWRSLVRRRRIEYRIYYLDFASGRTTELFVREGSASPLWLSVSPDERWILYTEVPLPESELRLVENFR